VASSFEFGFLQTAVLSFVFVQHGYESVLSDSVFRIAIATVSCRRYGDLHAFACDQWFSLLLCAAALPHWLCDIANL
jgi:hypothetical protein